jgi:hypothetical protein
MPEGFDKILYMRKFLHQYYLCYGNIKIPVDALHELQQVWWMLFRKELEIK